MNIFAVAKNVGGHLSQHSQVDFSTHLVEALELLAKLQMQGIHPIGSFPSPTKPNFEVYSCRSDGCIAIYNATQPGGL